MQLQVNTENARYLLNNGRLVALMTVAYSLIWWCLFAPSLSSSPHLLWLFCMLTLSAVFYFFARIQSEVIDDFVPAPQLTRYFSLATSSGVLWAVGILLFMPVLPASERLLLVVLVGALLSLVVVPNLLSIRSFNGFSIPLLLALLVSMVEASRTEWVACLVLLLSWGVLNIVLRRAETLVKANFSEGALNRAKALELADSHALMRHQSERDALTGLYNRAIFEQTLALHWRLSSRANTSLSLLLIDVDFFKPYNDHYGHVAGDQCLSKVANLFTQALQREDDIVARYGGEEFVMVLPNTDTKGALQVAARVRTLMAEAKLRHEYSTAASYVTVSIGISCLIPVAQQSTKEIVDKADKALYRAKQLGRNQAVVAARGEV
ncbi:diguanylate cyclase [Agarivorans sp. B2Z047]|uniref:GGDEF domain-containing protein n=1 Tax=Agarivorans sp. B2Z047 TaxID=2652721 RepID=UPI002019A4FB|nr:diguanylate cyclase [Agarivorans sp. B2Z047]UQN45299.1 GGDEF domain-containing protein [Agarivorans sp. B2Z047]